MLSKQEAFDKAVIGVYLQGKGRADVQKVYIRCKEKVKIV